MAAFLKHPTGRRPLPNAYASSTPIGRWRIPPRATTTKLTIDDDFNIPPLLSPDNFVLRSSYAGTSTSGVVLPKFWDGDADLFFSTIEAIFRVRGIGDEQSKLDSLLAALDMRHSQVLEHVLPDLNVQNAYSKAKIVLLQHFAPSSDDKLERLLHQSRLSDRTSPSRLLAEMRSLLGEIGLQDRLLRKLFLDRLPARVCRIIVSHPYEDLDQLAKIADRVMEEDHECTSAVGGRPEYDDSTSSVDTSHISLSTQQETVTDLAQTVTLLTHSLQSMPHTPHHSTNTRNYNATATPFSRHPSVTRDTTPPRSSTSVRLQSFSSTPSSSGHPRSWSPRTQTAWGDRPLHSSTPAPSLNSRPSRPQPQSSICHIHRKYGDQARNCAGNCAWRDINRNAFRNLKGPHTSIITGEIHPWVVRNPNTNIAFIIDTGSRDSIIPCQRPADDPRTSGYLSAADGSQIATYSTNRLL